MDVMQAIFHRRSIRRFDPRQIEEEALEPEMKAKLRLALLTPDAKKGTDRKAIQRPTVSDTNHTNRALMA